MPIKIPDQLPATGTLQAEGVQVLRETAATRQDVRPIKVGLLNLMPDKIATETQIARLVAATPLQVELTLIRMGSHWPKSTPRAHLEAFYRSWEEVEGEKFDLFIVTGAPLGMVPYAEIRYWDELKQIFDWTTHNVQSTLFVCWGAMAALYHFHGIGKDRFPRKAFGVFPHLNVAPSSPYLVGFSECIDVPVSRWTTLRRPDVERTAGLNVLLDHADLGPCLMHESYGNRLYMTNHLEYDADTLHKEYTRDLEGDPNYPLPEHYYPNDDVNAPPQNRWKAHAHVFFSNWINTTYQSAPFALGDIGRDRD